VDYHAEFFAPQEYACPCCGVAAMDMAFLEKIDEIRRRCGFPIYITSGCRCRRHNAAVGGAEYSAHLFDLNANIQSCAIDVTVYGYKAWCIANYAFQVGMAGIGWRQDGPLENRIIHLDDAESVPDQRARPRIWTY